MNESNTPFYWSTLFIRRLFELGVRNAVISPGSRSAPLTLALSAHNQFTKHVILDERSAAFTALGMAKASGKPVLLVCTSGTAAANYYPAVVEARQSGIPLIVASADRPPGLQKIGASQAIEQDNLYGDYPVFSLNAGLPSEEENDLARLRRAADQAWHFALHRCGPVHLNFPFKKPLEPDEEFFEKTREENDSLLEFKGMDELAEYEQLVELDELLWTEIVSSEKPVIVVGPSQPAEDLRFISKLSEHLKAPILAEPGAQIEIHKHTIDGFDGFLRNPNNLDELEADLVIRFGRQPVSKALNSYLKSLSGTSQIVFHHPELWADETVSATKSIVLKGALKVPEISGSASSKWLKKWKKVSRDFTKSKKEITGDGTLTDGLVFMETHKQIKKDRWVMLSNSFPVRDMQLFNGYHQPCFVNRGAAGIDGITSTAIGISLASQKPGILFTGDLAFLHNANALQQAHLIEKPLLVVILNNGGGTIFRMLPIHKFKGVYSTYFETPQNASFAHLCRAYDVTHTLVTRTPELADSIKSLINKPGLQVLECITDPDESMKQRKQLWGFEV